MKIAVLIALIAGAFALPARQKKFVHDPEENMDAVKSFFIYI